MSLVKDINEAISSLSDVLNEEVTKVVVASSMSDLVESTPADISARYWLMQFLEPLNRKELKSVVDGFLVQLLHEDQAKKLVRFLLARFPQYYEAELLNPELAAEQEKQLKKLEKMVEEESKDLDLSVVK